MGIRELKKYLEFLAFTPFHPQWLLARTNKKWVKLVTNELSGTVLDIGCGNRFLERYLREDINYIGIDYLITATEWYHSNPDIYADAKSIPVRDESVNHVFLLDVLEHVSDPDSCLKEVKRVLENGGKLVLQVPFIYPIHDSPLDFQRWSEYGLEKLIRECGLFIKSIEPIGEPLETSGMLFNISLCKYVLNAINKRNPVFFIIFLLPIIIPMVNICCFISSIIIRNDTFMPFRYRLIAEK